MKVPVSSINSTVSLSCWTSSTVPCIHTSETGKERPLPSLITQPAALSAVPQFPAALSCPDSTLTGGGRVLSTSVFSTLDITDRLLLASSDGQLATAFSFPASPRVEVVAALFSGNKTRPRLIPSE